MTAVEVGAPDALRAEAHAALTLAITLLEQLVAWPLGEGYEREDREHAAKARQRARAARLDITRAKPGEITPITEHYGIQFRPAGHRGATEDSWNLMWLNAAKGERTTITAGIRTEADALHQATLAERCFTAGQHSVASEGDGDETE